MKHSLMLILIIYAISTFIYILITRKRDKGDFYRTFTLFIVLLPFFGWLIIVIVKLALLFMNNNQNIVEEYSHYTKDDVEKIYSNVDFIADGKHSVPIEEVLILNDNETKRKVLTNILLSDSYDNSINQLLEAVKDDDTETSHYASSAIMELKKQYQNIYFSLKEATREFPNDKEKREEYLIFLKKYIDSGLIETFMLKRFCTELIQSIELMIVWNMCSEKYYEWAIKIMIDNKDYVHAKYLIKDYYDAYSNKEGPYLCYMAYYYAQNSYAMLKRALKSLRESDIVLSSHALEVVRFWIGDDNYV